MTPTIDVLQPSTMLAWREAALRAIEAGAVAVLPNPLVSDQREWRNLTIKLVRYSLAYARWILWAPHVRSTVRQLLEEHPIKADLDNDAISWPCDIMIWAGAALNLPRHALLQLHHEARLAWGFGESAVEWSYPGEEAATEVVEIIMRPIESLSVARDRVVFAGARLHTGTLYVAHIAVPCKDIAGEIAFLNSRVYIDQNHLTFPRPERRRLERQRVKSAYGQVDFGYYLARSVARQYRDGQKVPFQDALKYCHEVKGHPKLQPCGIGQQLRKLIWIDAYERGRGKPRRPYPQVEVLTR